MTQLERTEAVIDQISKTTYETCDLIDGLQGHARDLAKRLDAVMAEIESPEDWDYEAGSRLERAQRALYPEYFEADT